jgi:type IV secretory pathway VirB4 component
MLVAMVFRPLSILQDSVENRETNSGAVREHTIIVENEIQELRTKINNHLDKLQENMMKELTEAQKQITNGGYGLQTIVYLAR